MLQIDAHQHFWKYNAKRDTWMTDDMNSIKRDFMPDDLLTHLQKNNLDGTIAVQADQSETETDFLLHLSNENTFIKGVVGWVDLCSGQLEKRLLYYSDYKKLVGFRHVLQSEKQRDFMLRKDFLKGIEQLHKYSFSYDILIYPDQLSYASKLVSLFPNQSFVLDHMAKPDIRNQNIEVWAGNIRSIASYKNVYCKVAGIVTEAHWLNWSLLDFCPYLDVVVEAFGTDRLMFGSDWPVCNLAATYDSVIDIVKEYFNAFSTEEKGLIFGGNALKFYKLA